MKSLSATVLLVILLSAAIILVSIYFTGYAEATSKELKSIIDGLEEDIRSKSDNMHIKMSEVEKNWSDMKKIWIIMVTHSEMDEISESIIKLKRYIENSEISLGLSEAALLREKIMNVSERDRLNLENIL